MGSKECKTCRKDHSVLKQVHQVLSSLRAVPLILKKHILSLFRLVQTTSTNEWRCVRHFEQVRLYCGMNVELSSSIHSISFIVLFDQVQSRIACCLSFTSALYIAIKTQNIRAKIQIFLTCQTHDQPRR